TSPRLKLWTEVKMPMSTTRQRIAGSPGVHPHEGDNLGRLLLGVQRACTRACLTGQASHDLKAGSAVSQRQGQRSSHLLRHQLHKVGRPQRLRGLVDVDDAGGCLVSVKLVATDDIRRTRL